MNFSEKRSGLIRLPAVLERLQISKSTFYNEIKAGRLPAPLHPSPRTSAWRVADIEAAIEARAPSKESKHD